MAPTRLSVFAFAALKMRLLGVLLAVPMLVVSTPGLAQPQRMQRPPEPDTPFVWRDFEIMGIERISRAEIIEAIPLELGIEFSGERQDEWDRWAKAVRAKFGFDEVHITRLKWFPDHSVYLVVDIVEPERDGASRFRPRPAGDATIPPEVYQPYKHLVTLWISRRAGERMDGDYTTFSDDELNELAHKLYKLASPHRERILKVLGESADDEQRADAALLLNWVGEPADTVPRVIALLDDPSADVRNNITRYALPYVRRMNDPELINSVATALIKQIAYPSHGDRNKAISGLMMLSQNNPEIRDRVLREAGDRLRVIAETSVIPNVAGPAQALLSGDAGRMMGGPPAPVGGRSQPRRP